MARTPNTTVVIGTFFYADDDEPDTEVFGPFRTQAAALAWLDSFEPLFESASKRPTWHVTKLSQPVVLAVNRTVNEGQCQAHTATGKPCQRKMGLYSDTLCTYHFTVAQKSRP